MLSLFKKRHNPEPSKGADNLVDDEYYGPKRGIRAIALDELIKQYQAPFAHVCRTVGLPHDLEDKILRPILRRYASYVHLLPGSQNNHHVEPGGLLFHGYETAQIAVQSAEGVYFVVQGQPPSERKKMEPRWRVSLVIAAIAHDLGKPVTDMTVVADGVEAAWNPLNISLSDWLTKNNIKYYHYMWKENRSQQHKYAGILLLNKLIGDAASWLNEYGGHCIPSIMAYLSGGESQIGKLVSNADEVSANRSIKEPQSGSTNDRGYIPIKSRIIAAMKNAIESHKWTINTLNSHMYVDSGRAWLRYPSGMDAIISHLYMTSTPGLSKDPARIAQLLVETNIATPADHNGGMANPYWVIRPVGVQVGHDGLLALCIDASLLFDVMPDDLKVHVEGEAVEEKPLTQARGQSTITPAKEPPSVITHTHETPHQKTPPSSSATSEDQDTGSLTPDAALVWLEKVGGQTGAHIGMLARQINSNLTRWGVQLLYRDDCVWLIVPEGLPANVEIKDFQFELDRLVWIDRDIHNPMRHVRTIGNGRRGIKLKSNVSKKILMATGGKPSNNDQYEEGAKPANEGTESKTSEPAKADSQDNSANTPVDHPISQSSSPAASVADKSQDDHAKILLKMIAGSDIPQNYDPEIGSTIVKVSSGILPWYLNQYAPKGFGTYKLSNMLKAEGCNVMEKSLLIPIDIWKSLKKGK